jgi:hypothetical protein
MACVLTRRQARWACRHLLQKPLTPAACCDADHTKINSFRALAQVLLVDCEQVIDTDLTH